MAEGNHAKLAQRLQFLEHQIVVANNENAAEDLRQLVSVSFTGASAYSNVIILGGYAAYFALWTTMRQAIPPQLAAASALLMALSCFFFVSFEVHKMITQAEALKRWTAYTENESDPIRMLASFKRDVVEMNNSLVKLWTWALHGALWPGILAAGLLVGLFFYTLVFPMFSS